MGSISDLTVGSVADHARRLMDLGATATTLEETAQVLAEYARRELGNERDVVLARVFRTMPFGQLPEALRAKATEAASKDTVLEPSTRCLVLIGTSGVDEAWCRRTESRGHQVIPLPSETAVAQLPMVARLVASLGFDVAEVVRPGADLTLELGDRSCGVLHIEDAAGSAHVPAQESFVKPYEVRSVLGCGGALPSGELFVLILFARSRISAEVADLFRILAVSLKGALTPRDLGPYFSDGANGSTTRRAASSAGTSRPLPGRDSLVDAPVSPEPGTAEDRLTDLFESLGQMGTWEWSVGGDEVEWSDELYRIYGVDRAAFRPTFEGYLARVHEDDRERVQQTLQTTLGTEDAFDFNERIVRSSGEVRHLRSVGVVERDADGRPTRLRGACRDLTEARRAQEEAKRALYDLVSERAERAAADTVRRHLALLFENIPALMCFTVGSEHRYELVNPAMAEFLGRDDLVGKTVTEALPELVDQGFVELLDEVYRSGKPYVGNEQSAWVARSEGEKEEGYFNFVYQPLMDDRGAVLGILAHAVNVTEQVTARQNVEAVAEELSAITEQLEQSNRELERSNRELARSNRELDQFAYAASHDLKAPLRAISHLASWVARDLGDQINDQAAENLMLLRGRVERMQAMIDGILAFSRAGRIHGSVRSVSIGELVDDVLGMLEGRDGVEVVKKADVPPFDAEVLPLRQVIHNLLTNAIRHAHSKVTVEATLRADDLVEVAISDDGEGIAPEHHQRIWQLFQTLTPRDEGGGTGIGLAIVGRLVEDQRTEAVVESTVGEGATFRFSWPRKPLRR